MPSIGICFRFYTQMRVQKKTKLLPIKLKTVYTTVYVIQKVCWIQHIQLIFVIHTLWIFYWNEKKREKIHWKIHTGVYFGRNGPFFVTLACHHFTKEIKNFLEARTNVKFVPRGSWVRIILIIEWENRERLKKRICREFFFRDYREFFERLYRVFERL